MKLMSRRHSRKFIKELVALARYLSFFSVKASNDEGNLAHLSDKKSSQITAVLIRSL